MNRKEHIEFLHAELLKQAASVYSVKEIAARLLEAIDTQEKSIGAIKHSFEELMRRELADTADDVADAADDIDVNVFSRSSSIDYEK